MSTPLRAGIWAISLPVMFAELSETIIHVTDTAFLGRVGDTQLAALVLADTILGLWLVAALGLSDAMQIAVARRQGEGDEASAGKTFAQGAVVAAGMGVLLMVLLKLASPLLSDLIAVSDATSAAVDRFLQIAAYGIPFLCLSFAFSAFFIGIARTYVLALATVVLGVVNLVLGYGLILGNLSMPALGLRGAAYASVGAEVVTLVFMIGFAVRRGYGARYRMFRFGSWDRSLVWSLASLAGPVVVYGVVESLQWLFFFIILEHMGTAVLALSNVIYACVLVFLIPAEALSETTVSLVSNAIGKGGDYRSVHDTLRKVLRVGGLVTLPIALIAIAVPGEVFSIFFGVPNASTDADTALRVVAAAMLVAVPWLVWMGGIQGTGDTPAASAIDSGVSIVILAWAWAAGLVFGGGLTAVWSGLAAAWALGLAVAIAWMRSRRWERVSV